MRKCPRCKVVYYIEDRMRCLYCESGLVTIHSDTSVDLSNDKGFDPQMIKGLKTELAILKEVLQEWQMLGHLRLQYMIGTYFKLRTSTFFYSFSRQNFKMGNQFKRLFVQPIHLNSFFMIPWVVINVFDSIIMRFTYTGYCQKCGWKYKKVAANQEHDPAECAYNQDYTKVVNAILSGKITKTEVKVQQEALKVIKEGKRSAYQYLCSQRNTRDKLIDIFCVWLSVCMMIALMVFVLLPLARGWMAGRDDFI